MDASSLIDVIRHAVPGASLEAGPAADMPTLYVDREHLVEVCSALRDRPDLQFALLVDVTAVDLLPAVPRYELVYHLACVGAAYGTAPPARLRLKVRLPGDDVHVASVTGVWPAAGWPEREVFDLFGVIFDGHPDLRRILMTDDWQGHPLRKDYPVQIRKDTSAWLPLQLTPEEFAANVRGIREQAVDQATEGPFDRRQRNGTDESTGNSGA